MQTDVKDRDQNGKGNTEITHIFKSNELSGHASLCAVIGLEPGCSIGYHQHVGEEEIFYIIAGQARVVDDGQNEVLNCGDSHLIKSGSFHSLENIGNIPLKVVALILTY